MRRSLPAAATHANRQARAALPQHGTARAAEPAFFLIGERIANVGFGVRVVIHVTLHGLLKNPFSRRAVWVTAKKICAAELRKQRDVLRRFTQAEHRARL